MRTNSNVRPMAIMPLGDGTYHFNYNIEEVIDEEGNKSFNCDTVHVANIDYSTIVSSMIAQEYSIDEELAINRQRDVKADKFNEYFVYCEECKSIAREALQDNVVR